MIAFPCTTVKSHGAQLWVREIEIESEATTYLLAQLSNLEWSLNIDWITFDLVLIQFFAHTQWANSSGFASHQA